MPCGACELYPGLCPECRAEAGRPVPADLAPIDDPAPDTDQEERSDP